MFRFPEPVQEKLAGPETLLLNQVEAAGGLRGERARHGRKRQVKLLDFRPSRLISFGEEFAQFLSPVVRPVRQQARRPAPVYPPFDPFNTTYIPLPGPSSPHYALRLETDNPHLFEKARFLSFR